jgi:hypothetical protein
MALRSPQRYQGPAMCRTMPTQITLLGERQVRIRMMTRGMKDDGYDLLPQGCLIDDYLQNPIQLNNHDYDQAVGTNSNLQVTAGAIDALNTFAPAGVSPRADEICGLVKAGVIKACSIGFHVKERQPVNPRDPTSGWLATRWSLDECSWVAVGLDPGAFAVERSRSGRDDSYAARQREKQQLLDYGRRQDALLDLRIESADGSSPRWLRMAQAARLIAGLC